MDCFLSPESYEASVFKNTCTSFTWVKTVFRNLGINPSQTLARYDCSSTLGSPAGTPRSDVIRRSQFKRPLPKSTRSNLDRKRAHFRTHPEAF